MSWMSRTWSEPVGRRALFASCACSLCVLLAFYSVYLTHSLLLMLASVRFVLFAVYHFLTSGFKKSVVVIFLWTCQDAGTTVLDISLERIFRALACASSWNWRWSSRGCRPPRSTWFFIDILFQLWTTEEETAAQWPYILAALSSSTALVLSAYAVKSGPFQHVLTAATSSSLQEHAADLSHAVCWAVPGLSRLLLPRINAMTLLAFTTSSLILLCEYFRHEFHWADPVACLLLSCAVFSTMLPLSMYTGRILLQTCPPHLLNQLDRCISEASTIEGVLELRAGHFWQLDFSSLVGTVDVRVRRDADEQLVLASVTDKLSSVVSKLTVQVVKDAAWQQQPVADYSAANGYAPNPGYYQRYEEPAAHDDHGHSHSGPNAYHHH